MTALPHPSLSLKERENFDYIESLINDKYVYQEFSSESIGRVFTLPRNSILLFGTIVFVSDPFDDGVSVHVGEIGSGSSVFSALVDVGGVVPEIIVGNLDSNITVVDTPIYIGFRGDKPTKGKGWFLIKYLLVDRLT